MTYPSCDKGFSLNVDYYLLVSVVDLVETMLEILSKAPQINYMILSQFCSTIEVLRDELAKGQGLARLLVCHAYNSSGSSLFLFFNKSGSSLRNYHIMQS